jgi:thymidylate synthase
MEIIGDSLDAVMIKLYKALLSTRERNEDGTRGPSQEMLGVTLRITNPRSRLSRSEDRGKPFSAIGELLWYLSKSDRLDFIKDYVPKYKDDAVDGSLPGAYGPRLFAMRGSIDQIDNVAKLLQRKPGSRRAVIQLFDAEDIAVHKTEIPCTTTLQFHLRNEILKMSVNMRSNDAYFGFPHDVFCFTMIQEMMARRLGVDIGEYIHHVGSMHVYDTHVEAMRSYIVEGHQNSVIMPPMPEGNPFDIVPTLLEAEKLIARHTPVQASDMVHDPYWADIIRLVQTFWASGCDQRLDELKAEFSNPIYKVYLEGRRGMKKRPPKALDTASEPV